MRAAMVGGAGYAAGKRRARAQEHEAEQDAQLQQAQQAPAPQAPAPAAGGGDMSETERLDALKKLGELHDSGVLTDEQFEAEKEKLI
jgi:Short C-terminal domain